MITDIPPTQPENHPKFSDAIAKLLPSNPKAFIVDDSVPTRRIFKMMLTELGFEVEEAVNGRVALDALETKERGRYVVIFSDISMPKMDGFEFCYRLQQSTWYDGTPFVLVSTESDSRNVMKGLKFGADDFMPKPFDKEIVAQVIMRVMRNV
ncbi:MAG: response regulator [Planctomycetaceae bacterium]|jgi:DNA-binding response OmpR family regulator|nr:response regulator [Planctomycetaceae bacterium]